MARRLKKWNYNTHEYETYDVPESWRVAQICPDMETVINCASCGKAISFGASYGSMVIHGHLGISYCVCPKCHSAEIEAKIAAQEKAAEVQM